MVSDGHAGGSLPRHERRLIAGVEVFTTERWSVKLYAIAGGGRPVPAAMLDVARALAARALPRPAVTGRRYGAGFVIVHEAPAFNTVTVDWWEETNELRHRVYRAMPDQPDAFVDITASGEMACVWELRVLAHERQAWIETMLGSGSGSDTQAYLGRMLTEWA